MPLVQEHRARVVVRRARPLDARAPRAAGSGSPYQFGDRSASSFQTDSASGYSGQSQPSARASAITISRSPRAFPGSGTAARTRLIRRSVFVNVPSFSAKLDAGKTTFAKRVEVSFRNRSCATRNSSFAQPLLDVVRVRLGLRRVLADQVERLDPAVVEAGHHLVEPVAGALGQVDAPGGRELLPHLRVVPGLVARGSSAGSRPSRSGPGRCSGRGARSGPVDS